MQSPATNLKQSKQRLSGTQHEFLADIRRFEGEAQALREAAVRGSADDVTSSQRVFESLREDTLAWQTLTQVRDALRSIADRALEYTEHAYRLAKDAHNKSGQIGSL
jgi:hypothetical protein